MGWGGGGRLAYQVQVSEGSEGQNPSFFRRKKNNQGDQKPVEGIGLLVRSNDFKRIKVTIWVSEKKQFLHEG